MEILAERYLDPQYAPDAVADKTGIPAATIRRIAAELVEVAFNQEIRLDVEWTDWDRLPDSARSARCAHSTRRIPKRIS